MSRLSEALERSADTRIADEGLVASEQPKSVSDGVYADIDAAAGDPEVVDSGSATLEQPKDPTSDEG